LTRFVCRPCGIAALHLGLPLSHRGRLDGRKQFGKVLRLCQNLQQL
jgi:hypothetical protein